MSHRACKCVYVDIQKYTKRTFPDRPRQMLMLTRCKHTGSWSTCRCADRPTQTQLPGSSMPPLGHQPPWASWAPGVKVGLARAGSHGCSARVWGMPDPGGPLSASALPSLCFHKLFLQEALPHHALPLSARGGGCPHGGCSLDPTPIFPLDPFS